MNLLSILAPVPIIWLIVELLFFGRNESTLKACVRTLIIAVILAVVVWKMPIRDIASACFEGVVMSLWPISTVIVAAVFLYDICSATGNMQYISDTLASVSKDRRVLVLLVVWGFGGFIEGIAGFGTSIAIVTSMLIALDFPPHISAALALVSNPISSVFGSLGVQMLTLAQVTKLQASDLAVYSTYVVIPIVFLTPFILVYITGKAYNIKPIFSGIWGIEIVSAVSFAASMYFVVKYVNENLTGVASAIFSLMAMVLVIAVSSRKRISFRSIKGKKLKKQLIAWSPFILCVLFLTVTSKLFLPVNKLLSNVKIAIPISIGEQSTEYVVNLLTTSTLWIFLSAFFGGKLQGLSTKQCTKILYSTILRMRKTIVTLMILLSISRIMTYSGMIKEIAMSLVCLTGSAYFIAVPFLGTVGAFITGSATSANVLLGSLQVTAANELGKTPSLFMAFSIVGGTIGKMMSPQNIAVGINAAKIVGQESMMFRELIKWYILYLSVLMGLSIIANVIS